jgi:hypothetical protein
MANANLTQALVLGGKGIQPNDYARGAYAGTQPVNVHAASTASVVLSTLMAGSILDDVVLALGDLGVGRASCNTEAEAQFIGFAVNGALTNQTVYVRKNGNVLIPI